MADHPTPSDTLSALLDSKKRARTITEPDAPTVSDITTSQSESTRTSKRLRTISSRSDELVYDHPSVALDYVFERRRVNPESLALRLGPELVHDLDALITPGNRDMPSFAVRKELQERFNIDRRHIYDYYHSKGLRVVKEGGNGNLGQQTLQANLASQPALRLLRQAPSKSLLPLPTAPALIKRKPQKPASKILKVKPIASHSKKLPTVRKAKHSPPAKRTHPRAQPSYSHTETETSTCMDFVPSCFFTNPMEPYLASEDDFHSSPPCNQIVMKGRVNGQTPVAYPSNPIFEKMIQQRQHADPVDLPERFNTQPSPRAIRTRSEPLPMTQDERMEFYDFLAGVLGPARGIQQSVSTYKAYMEEQSRLYFERLFPNSSESDMRQRPTETLLSELQAHISSDDSVNFRRWLGSDSFPDTTISSVGSSSHYNSDGTISATTSTKARKRTSAGWTREDSLTSFISPNSFGQTLDDLFLDLRGNGSLGDEVLESPVLRSNVSGLVLSPSLSLDGQNFSSSPRLVLPHSPGDQSNSPDLESSPFIQTPGSIYQQFTQPKDSHFGLSYPAFRTTPRSSTLMQGDLDHSDAISSGAAFVCEAKQFEKPLEIQGSLAPIRESGSGIAARHIRMRPTGRIAVRVRTPSAGGI